MHLMILITVIQIDKNKSVHVVLLHYLVDKAIHITIKRASHTLLTVTVYSLIDSLTFIFDILGLSMSLYIVLI